MKVNEIFKSIQGEGTQTGIPTIFLRLYGCNNQCSYCDTKYAMKEFTEMDWQKVVSGIFSLECFNVCVTGGEPLLHKEELLNLIKALPEFTFWIETNGTQDIIPFLLKNCFIVMDVKSPSSGMSEKTLWNNLNFLREKDQVKFVIATQEDYDFATKTIKEYSTEAEILFSPCFKQDDFIPEITSAQMVDKILKDQLKVRLSLQVHKIVWDKNKRGV